MKIIDAHAHIYPDKIALKAASNIGSFYGVPMNADGTVSALLARNDSFGVYKTVVSSVATTAEQVVKINDYMASQKSVSGFIPLATLHPDMDEGAMRDEAARIRELGLHGIKLHPDFQKFKISGEKARKMFDILGDYGAPILVHTGDRRMDYSHPEYMIEAARDYPHLTFIAAHFGGWSEWGQAMKYKGLKNVMFDTCSTLMFIDPDIAKNVLYNLGTDKFMFGTDYPMWDIAADIERVLSLGLGDAANEDIFYNNAARLFGVK